MTINNESSKSYDLRHFADAKNNLSEIIHDFDKYRYQVESKKEALKQEPGIFEKSLNKFFDFIYLIVAKKDQLINFSKTQFNVILEFKTQQLAKLSKFGLELTHKVEELVLRVTNWRKNYRDKSFQASAKSVELLNSSVSNTSYIYSQTVSSMKQVVPQSPQVLLRAAAIFGLVTALILPVNSIVAFAEETPTEIISTETSVENTSTTEPTVAPIPEPSAIEVGSEVIVEETPVTDPSPSVSPSPEVTESVSPTPSPTVTVPLVVVNAPTNLSFTPVVEGIKLTWDKTYSEIDKYIVKVEPDNRLVDVSKDVNELLLADLDRKATYSFSVWAVSGEVSSEITGPLTVDLSTLKFPRPPMNAEVGGLIVKFDGQELSSQDLTNLADTTQLEPVSLEVSSEIATDTRLVEFNQPVDVTTANEIADALEATTNVEYAELDFAFLTASETSSSDSFVPNDPLYATKQWSLWGNFGVGVADGPTGLALAYKNSTGLGSVVAVIDTGFTNHPDLDGQFVSGYDFVSNNEMLSGIREENGTAVPYDGDYIDSNTYGPIGWDDNPLDPGDWNSTRSSSWHGTYIAGLIAAKTNNGIGIAGIAPDTRIQPIRAFSWRGGLLSDVIASITWASGGTVENVPANQTPAKVINLSFSVEAPCTPSLQQAIDEAINRGSVVVAAAGNNNQDAANFAPGNCQNVVTVGAINSDGDKANYSNFGSSVDISAPGGEIEGQAIYSTSNEGTTTSTNPAYVVRQGTSIATAQVSAAIAKLAQTYPTENATQLKARVLSKEATKPFPTGKCLTDKNCGIGYLFFGLSSAPTISASGVSPSAGTAAGGTSVTITGTNFTGATRVTFGGIEGTNLTVVSSTQITVDTPVRSGSDRTVGAVPVIVTNPDGSSNNDVTFTFRPVISLSGSASLVQLGELASRSQSKPVVRTTSSSPYTTTGTDSRSNESYSFTTTRNYGNSGAYAYESDDRSSRPGTSLSSLNRTEGSAEGRSNVITLTSSGGIDSIPVGGSSYNSKDGHQTYGSAFGPEVYSEAFYATSSQAISFDWKASGGGDDYEIYAFLVALSDLNDVSYSTTDHTIIAHGMGSTSDWSTASASIPSNGYYKFRFVNGTFDASGGLAVGAQLFVHNQVTVGTSNVISFTNPGDQIGAANATFSFNVSATSGSAVEMTSTKTNVCTVSEGSVTSGQTPITVTKKTTGTCTLIASQGATGIYAPAQNVSRSFEIRNAATSPDAPTLTSATGGTGTLSLAFNPGNDGGSAITNYEYSLNNGSTWTTLSPAVTSSPISLSGITSGTYSQIKIRAVNSVGTGTASNSRSATVTASPPSPPTSLSGISGNGQVSISFTAGSDAGSPITNYEYSIDGTNYTALSPADDSSPILITGLINGTVYSITLKAVNANGTSSASSPVLVTPQIPSSSGGTVVPTPSPTITSRPTPRPTNLIINPLIVPTPSPSPTQTTIIPGTPNRPEPLIKKLIEELIDPLKPKIIDLFTSPTPRSTNVSGTNTPVPIFDNQRALELIPTSPDKKVVELPSLVLVNDIPEPSKVVIVDNTTAQIVTPGGGLLNVAATDGQERIPVDNRGRVQMVRDNNVETEGKGLAPNTEFAVYLFSEPILLGVGKTDNKGQFFASFPVEDELPIGDHTLQVNGLLPDGKTASVSMPVVIVDSVETAKNQAMPETVLVNENPVDKALRAVYWILIVLAAMVFLIAVANRNRFFALFRRRDEDGEPQTI